MMVEPLLARIAARALTATTFATLATIFCASLLVAPVSAAPDAHSILAAVKRNHREADTLLASLRDDVYKAVLSGTRGDMEHIKAVQTEFAEHAGNLKARVKASGELGIDENLRWSLHALQDLLDVYIRSAEELIAVAGDQEKAVLKLDGFQAVFEALETAMSTFGDLIDAQVWQRKQALAQNPRFSPHAVLGWTLLGMALMLILVLAVYRNTAGAIRRTLRAADNPRAAAGDLTYR
jgi:methyl-accepting chemotaxis protein